MQYAYVANDAFEKAEAESLKKSKDVTMPTEITYEYVALPWSGKDVFGEKNVDLTIGLITNTTHYNELPADYSGWVLFDSGYIQRVHNRKFISCVAVPTAFQVEQLKMLAVQMAKERESVRRSVPEAQVTETSLPFIQRTMGDTKEALKRIAVKKAIAIAQKSVVSMLVASLPPKSKVKKETLETTLVNSLSSEQGKAFIGMVVAVGLPMVAAQIPGATVKELSEAVAEELRVSAMTTAGEWTVDKVAPVINNIMSLTDSTEEAKVRVSMSSDDDESENSSVEGDNVEQLSAEMSVAGAGYQASRQVI